MMGKLFVVSGPSGAGKSTLTKDVVKKLDNLELSISATTRKPRKGEKDNIDYHFLDEKTFKQKIEEDGFLEYALVHGNFYGTLKDEVLKKIKAGKNLLLEIDVQGGIQIKEKFDDAVLIFIKAPSETELKERLKKRDTDTEEVINLRLKNSLEELKYEKDYKYVIVNDNFEKALKKLGDLILGN
ncbi:guanylate kinase [Haliovirga abyssi]|uniref:Guanylate kinase n=1 Tax=Haliovirga abyssi TaxID=2996794 RepID=A0AAU9DK55_9FUSO|nr:guanylate kinase [Haliovirga abyssi]BDU51284.1 guanylate kinase [Haliovirga abyssi]